LQAEAEQKAGISRSERVPAVAVAPQHQIAQGAQADEQPPAPLAGEAGRQAQYQEIQHLMHQGWSLRAIAQHVQLSRNTVSKYSRAESCPTRGSRGCKIDAYRAYLVQRWEAGCQNGRELFAELEGMGFQGRYPSVARALQGLRTGRPTQHVTTIPRPRTRVNVLSARRAMWLFVQEEEKLAAADAAYRTALYEACPHAELITGLSGQFRTMIRERDPMAFDAWLKTARTCPVPELKRFAEGLQNDYAAVRAAVEGVWSNGQTEGQVNRLKVLKRMMYGRAGFDLLRARVLYRAA
jgi:transposase